jgi:hypothetical protein
MSLEMAHKVIVPPKKNYIPQFLKQRDINSYCVQVQREQGWQTASSDRQAGDISSSGVFLFIMQSAYYFKLFWFSFPLCPSVQNPA